MRRLLFVAVLCLMALSVSAVDFTVSLFPNERTIKSNETAVFELELEHSSPVEEMFEVYSNDVTWDVRPEKILSVPAGEKIKTNLLVHPLNLNPGAYNLPIFFKRTGSSDQQKVYVYVAVESLFPEDATYLPAVRGVATVDEEVDPRKGMTIKLSLENQNRRILDKVNVKVRSTVINKDYTTNLGPLEKKTLTFLAELDPFTPPGKDALQISIIVPEKEKAYQFDLFPVPFKIVEYGVVIPSVETQKSFLKRIETVTLTNEGNKPLAHIYRVPAWFAKQWFISASPAPRKEAGNLVWEVPLDAGSSAQLMVTYNHRPLFWLLLIVSVIIAAYYVFRSPIAVNKRASVVSSHEGGITELKIVIELVNRSNKIVKSIRVMDLAPKLADVEKDFKETILAPSKIVPHEHTGTLVRWDIDMMEPREHRILTYKMKTRLQILGGMTLPVTAVKYFVAGQEREVVSNKPEIRTRS
jgi:hypothetical protein